MRRRPDLTREMVLEAPMRSADAAGGYSTGWQALGTLWASVDAGTGRAAEAAGLSVAAVPGRIVLRAAPAGSPRRPVPGQRLREGARLFHILAVTEMDGTDRYLTCFVREAEVPA